MSCRAPYEETRCSVATLALMSTPSRVKGRSHHSPSMVVSTDSTLSGAARVPTPTGPIGQSEFSMSKVCWARMPGGVRVSICRPGLAAFACGAGEGAQPGARVTTSAAAAPNAATRRRAGRPLISLVVPGNVQHNLEFQQRCACRHGVGPVPGMGFDSGAARPRLERFVGLPVRHHEVAVLTLDRAQQLEAEETGLVLHRVRAMGEPLLQFGAGVCGYFDCIDLHHLWHSARLPRPRACPTPGRQRKMVICPAMC